ncbi:hypothetical protein GCM10009718_10330 [Isoptericola halotolerans]|uniref:Uncharacterized protein n=1 Tax=Isoptericola halotolerans TaxID=300560 RepID=A0ABX1ZZU1_9MICO|nr:hypothetical protein [Isoptericola halotolerans]NOV96045.1 hypothetical protein [Isoptericola halotolerans]
MGNVLAGGALVLAADLHTLPLSLAATGDVPDAVLESLQPGGAGLAWLAEHDQELPSGTAHGAVRTFDDVHRYAYLDLAPGSAGATLTESDFDDLPPFYITVDLLDGTPESTLIIEEDGAFGGYGGFAPEEVDAIAAMEPGQVLLTDGRFGEAYAASAELTTVRALSEEAADLIGSGEIDVQTLRDLKTAQWAELEADHQDEPADADGAAGVSERASTGLALAVGGALLVAAAAVLLLRSRGRT